MIPTLETERLMLREWRAGDLNSFAAMMADPEVTKFISGKPLSPAESWRSAATMSGHWQLRGYGNWAVVRKEDGAFIGRVGRWYPEGWPMPEFGWLLGKPYWGKGYAFEAASAGVNFCFLTTRLEEIVSLIDPRNEPSKALASRLGESSDERREFDMAGRTVAVDVWRITREQWARSVACGKNSMLDPRPREP